MEEIVVYQSIVKRVIMVILGIAMTLLCVGFLVFAFTMSSPSSTKAISQLAILAIIAVMGLLFFGACTFMWARLLFTANKALVITSEGIYDYSSATASGDRIIRWEEILSVRKTGIMTSSFISLSLRDPESFINSLSPAKQKIVRANARLGYGEINISLQGARGMSYNRLLEIIEQNLERYWASRGYVNEGFSQNTYYQQGDNESPIERNW